jgi:hypothetical protein
MDARVRHDPAIKVIVSGRIVGRAEGGMADAIRRRMVRQDEFADDLVEPVAEAARRYGLRGRARAAWQTRRIDTGLSEDLDIPPSRLLDALSRLCFGAAWAELERISPLLKRRRVRFAELREEIAHAEYVLRHLAPAETMAAD